jgi:hypothetical protein
METSEVSAKESSGVLEPFGGTCTLQMDIDIVQKRMLTTVENTIQHTKLSLAIETGRNIHFRVHRGLSSILAISKIRGPTQYHRLPKNRHINQGHSLTNPP